MWFRASLFIKTVIASNWAWQSSKNFLNWISFSVFTRPHRNDAILLALLFSIFLYTNPSAAASNTEDVSQETKDEIGKFFQQLEILLNSKDANKAGRFLDYYSNHNFRMQRKVVVLSEDRSDFRLQNINMDLADYTEYLKNLYERAHDYKVHYIVDNVTHVPKRKELYEVRLHFNEKITRGIKYEDGSKSDDIYVDGNCIARFTKSADIPQLMSMHCAEKVSSHADTKK